MGGNVFKNDFEVSRLDDSHFKKLQSKLAQHFEQLGYVVAPVPSYNSKESHGDLDLLFKRSEICNRGALFEEALVLVNYEEDRVSANGDCVSFLYNHEGLNFQVDAILTSAEDFETSLGYFSFNDLGNLMGRLAHMLGLKYGHDGLSYMERDGDQVLYEFNLSKDTAKIHEFLGVDPLKTKAMYERGPDSLKDIFEYVVSSKYFNPDVYLLHNRNHVSRVRDRKRKTYMEFLQYCENLNPTVRFERPEDKTPYRLMAVQYFDKEALKAKLDKEVLKNKERKAKLNGQMVGELTSLEGKELGAFMQELKRTLTPEVVDSLSSEQVKLFVLKEFLNFKGLRIKS